jgi:hypothetical protein
VPAVVAHRTGFAPCGLVYACFPRSKLHVRTMWILAALCVCAVAALCVPPWRRASLIALPLPRSRSRARAFLVHRHRSPQRAARRAMSCAPDTLADALVRLDSEKSSLPDLPGQEVFIDALFLQLMTSDSSVARSARLLLIAKQPMSPHLLRVLIRRESTLIDEGGSDHFDQLHVAASRAVALSFEALAPLNPDTAIDLIWAAQIYAKRDVTPRNWAADCSDAALLIHAVYCFDSSGFCSLGDVVSFIEACLPMNLPSAPTLAKIAAQRATGSSDPLDVLLLSTLPFRADPSRIAPVVALVNAGATAPLDELVSVSSSLGMS